MSGEEFSDPRLVALYDTLNPLGADTDFYLEIARKLHAAVVIDSGCGTGLLTCELARRGHRAIGVDPASAMLEVARRRPGGNAVKRIEGDATKLGAVNADLAIMTGHAAQVFLEEADWRRTLASIHWALGPAGHLVFESRNPEARRWTRWTKASTLREVSDPEGGKVAVWVELLEEKGNRVRFEMHYLFDRSGEELTSTSMIVFRSEAEIRASLLACGFSVEAVYGDWDGRPLGAMDPELIFVAVRRPD